MRSTLVVAVLAAASAPAFAAEAGPSYNYADVGYVNVDGDADGFGVEGSFAINEQFHVLGGAQRVSDGPVSATVLSLAGGYRFGLSDTTDFVARAGLARARVGVSGVGSANENGWMVQGGVRSMLNPTLEVNGFATVMDLGSTELGIGGGIVKTFSERVGAFAELELVDGDYAVSLGARFGF